VRADELEKRRTAFRVFVERALQRRDDLRGFGDVLGVKADGARHPRPKTPNPKISRRVRAR